MRNICYVTGTRADFGLMKSTLELIQKDDALALSVIATGSHFSEKLGNTIDEVEQCNFEYLYKVPIDVDSDTHITMATNIGEMIKQFSILFDDIEPDVVLLLGDRGEMLAAAIAAAHLNIHIAHIHGGERSGTIDESVRHAISKFSHFHFTSTQCSKERLERMGEMPDNVFVVGAPGLDEMHSHTIADKCTVFERFGFSMDKPLALFVYHPVIQDTKKSRDDVEGAFRLLLELEVQVLALMPNIDAGYSLIRQSLKAFENEETVKLVSHLPRNSYLSVMCHADVMVGNSSSGIIEAATYGTPVINLGRRQNLRERNKNVIDLEFIDENTKGLVTRIIANGKFDIGNVYGSGKSAEKILEYLKTLALLPDSLNKSNTY